MNAKGDATIHKSLLDYISNNDHCLGVILEVGTMLAFF